MPRVHQEDAFCRIPREVGARQRVERLRGLASSARVPVSGEIHQIQRHAASSGDTVDVRESRLTGGSARARNPLPDQRVNQARLADIRTPHESDFTQTVPGEIAGGCGTNDEISGNLQWVIVSSTALSTGAVCASGDNAVSGPVSAIFRTSSIVWTM